MLQGIEIRKEKRGGGEHCKSSILPYLKFSSLLLFMSVIPFHLHILRSPSSPFLPCTDKCLFLPFHPFAVASSSSSSRLSQLSSSPSFLRVFLISASVSFNCAVSSLCSAFHLCTPSSTPPLPLISFITLTL